MIENFVEFAMKNYRSPNVTIEEFKRDCDKFLYLNKLFNRYYNKSDLNVRLILNHIVILYNVFESDACTKMLFNKIKPEYWPGLKTILLYLNYMPDNIETVPDSDIMVDLQIADELRKI